MAIETNGVIYYKLDSNIHGYKGDITKNCGLRGEEIDSNFNFLRGQDIETISFNEKGELVIKRYNGEILNTIPVNTVDYNYDFSFNQDLGILTIISPDGNEIKLEGFSSNNIYHNCNFEGDGSHDNPLRLSNIVKTGKYSPAIKLIDTINTTEKLPTENINLHDRYVTKEEINPFGRLYPLKSVEEIDNYLKEQNSEWHVPSKDEWDELLNAIDCHLDKPHSSTDSNKELGEFAGAALKGIEYWKEYNGKILSDDKYNFSIYPLGYCGDRGIDYYGSFGETACYWTSTVEDDNKDMFIKSFNYDKETVRQNTWSENYYLSLRLVKKLKDSNFYDEEIINGYTCKCIHIPGSTTIWTKYNIDFSQFENFAPSEWKQYKNSNKITTHYFINDWNGNNWVKLEIKEGESIVLYESEKGAMHEFILVNGELIDQSIFINEDFQNKLNNLANIISENEEIISSSLNDLNERLITEQQERLNNDTSLQSQINIEVQERKNSDNLLIESINHEEERATKRENEIENLLNSNILNLETNLNNKLTNEQQERLNNDTSLQSQIDTEIQERINSIKDVNTKIEEETNRSQEKENELNLLLTQEKERATLKENEIINELNNEINRAKENELNIENTLNDNIINLTTNLNNEVNRATDEENQIKILLNQEKERAIEQENNLETSLINLNNTLNEKTHLLNDTIENLEKNLIYNGENAITISNENKIISLKLDENDKILSNSPNGLLASLSLKWVHYDAEGAKDEIQLIGKNNIILSRIDIKELINNDNNSGGDNNYDNEIIQNLQTQINTLKNNLQETKDEINSLMERLINLETQSITNITGVDNEISVTVTDNTAKIGFAENAQFIAG